MALYPFKDFVTTLKDGVSKALRISGYDPDEDNIKMASVQKKWRDSFSGSSLDTTNKWDLVQQGAGQTITVANGELQITSGTTASAETIIMSKETFSDPFRALFSVKMSQKIANTDMILEAVSVDPTTGLPDGVNVVQWRISGSDSTTTTNGIYTTKNGATQLDSGNSTINAVTSYNILEIELFSDEVWWHARVMDSTNGRSNSYVRHQQIPDPNGLYKVRVHVLNRSTAPASSTTCYLQYVTVIDYAELTAEITAGRGNVVAGQGIFANVAGTVTASIYGSNAVYTDTTTNLTASQLYTGTGRDAGTSPLYNRFRATVAHTAGNGHGHLIFEQSTDNVTYRETHRIPIPSDGLYRTLEFPINMRYVRIKFQNGATAQTQMFLATTMVRIDGVFDMDKTLSFTHSTTALTASSTFTGVTLDIGGNFSFNRHRAQVYADQAGTLYLEESLDGTTWRVCASQAVTAGSTVTLEDLIVWRYLRVRYVNGATAQTAFNCTSALVRQ